MNNIYRKEEKNSGRAHGRRNPVGKLRSRKFHCDSVQITGADFVQSSKNKNFSDFCNISRHKPHLAIEICYNQKKHMTGV